MLLLAALGLPVAVAVGARADPLTAAALGPTWRFSPTAQDWDWELPAVTVPALACAVALLLSPPAVDSTRPRAEACRRGGGARARRARAHRLRRNRELALAEAGSERSARRAARLQPWSSEPWRVLGEAQLERGEVRPPGPAFGRA